MSNLFPVNNAISDFSLESVTDGMRDGCPKCGSHDIYRGARLHYDKESQNLIIRHIGGFVICPKCPAAFALPMPETSLNPVRASEGLMISADQLPTSAQVGSLMTTVLRGESISDILGADDE